MGEVYKNFIDGKWVEAASRGTFSSFNPANKFEVIGSFPRSDHRDVDKAVEAAKGHYEDWRKIPAPKRAEIFFRVAGLMVQRRDELAELVTREMGKILSEAKEEVQEAINMCYYIAGEGRRLLGETAPSEHPDRFCMTIRVPLGVVACITPWSFPLAVPARKLIPALIAGNTVVFKPSKDTPLCGTRLVELFLEAGLPPGVVNLIHGLGEEAGAPLVRHPDVTLVSFTGSSEVGREIGIACAAEQKKVALEMGGKNPLIVLDDADLDLAVEGAICSGFATTGQRCTAASRLIVHKKVLKEFSERFGARAQSLRLGNGLDPTTDIGPIINEQHLKRIHNYTKVGLREGAKLFTGGEVYREGECKKGFFYLPTIFTEVRPTMRIAQEEIFGPTVVIIPAMSLEEAISIANATRYGLSSAIYTRDIHKAFIAMRDISAGITHVNMPTIGAEVHLPFGGVKHTGSGYREGGTTVMDIFTEWKTLSVDFGGKSHPLY